MGDLSIELQRSEKMTLRDWDTFLRQARVAGSGDDAVVSEVVYDGTDVVGSYRIDIPVEHTATDLDKEVRLPAWLVQDLLSVVREVAQSDGDVRGLVAGAQTALQRAYGHLLEPVLGEDLYGEATKEDD